MMPNNYTDIHNRHEVYVARLATQLLNEHVYSGLNQAYKAARLILLDDENITSFTQLNKITAAVTKSVTPIITESWYKTTQEMEDFAAYEAEFYAKMFGNVNDVVLAVPVAKSVLSQITSSLMTLHSGAQVKSDIWENYTKKNALSVVDTYNAQIRAGYSNNETLNEISKRLKTVSDELLKRNAEALGRTGLSHYASQSREILMKANRDIVPNKYFNSVFDSRRTIICAGYAAKPLYSMDDESAPVFPLHFGERSNWLYLIAGQTEPQGTRPAVGGVSGDGAEAAFNKRESALAKRRANENIIGATSSRVKYRGRKDNDIFNAGQIDGGTSSDAWLRSNPRWFIESALGKKRAALFIDKGVSIDKFIDMTGRPLTLKELMESGV
jgi:hypothetical protein